MNSHGHIDSSSKIRRLIVLFAVHMFMTAYNVIYMRADNRRGADYLRSTYWEDVVSDTSLPYYSRISGIDSLLKHGNPDSPGLMKQKARLLSDVLMYSRSAETYENLWNVSSALPIDQKLEILREWIIALGMAGNMSKAAKKSIELLKLEKPDSLKILETDAYVSLAFSKMELGMTDKAGQELIHARNTFEKYKRYASPANRRIMEITLIRAEVTLLTLQGKHKKALESIKRAFELADDELTETNLNGYLADIYLGAGDYEAAERYYRKILETDFSYHNRAVAVSNYMDLLISEKRYQEALDVLEKNITRIPFRVEDITTSNLIANKSEALAGTGNFKAAYLLMHKSKVMRDSINTAFLAGDHLAIYELEQEASQKDQALKQAGRLRVWLWIVITVLFIALLCSIWLAMKWHNEKEINKSNVHILATADMDHRKKINVKDDKINTQSRELTVHALKIAQLNELTNAIISMIEDKSESATSRLKNIKDRIRQFELQDNMWDVFKTYFEQTHPDFFKTLYILHPDLSPNEVRMCAYIRLNLTTKEIAALTNRSSRTVETVKYRLHKKLGLDDESTVAYLNRIKNT